MATPNKLGISFTPAEITTIKTGIDAAMTVITSKGIFNLSPSERQALSKVGPEREPYVNKSVTDYGINIPAFNPIAWPIADAVNDANTYGQMGEVLTAVSQLKEMAEELQMLAGHFAFQFMLGQYNLAQDNLDTNVAGAQTIVDGEKGAFERNPAEAGGPPTP